jgi:putative membrane protein
MSGPPAWSPYCGPGAAPADLLVRWNLDLVLLAALGLTAIALWRCRSPLQAWFSLTVLAVIFISPLCALSSALFSARTVHHVLLIAVAAPLAAWSSKPTRTPALGPATAASVAVFWAWHAPAAYAWALSHDGAYWFMQISLAVSALWFWMAVRSASPLAAVGALLASTVQMGLLGALLTVAGRPIYAAHAATTFAWGMTPLEDQQAAGLIMWAPAAAIYLAFALVLLRRQLRPGPTGEMTA